MSPAPRTCPAYRRWRRGDERCAGPVLSFTIEGLRPADAAYILEGGYHIRVRSGLHCAPLIHSAMGAGNLGTVRASVSSLNTEQDIGCLIGAVREIVKSLEDAHEDRR